MDNSLGVLGRLNGGRKKALAGKLLDFPALSLVVDELRLFLPEDLRAGISAVAKDTGYSEHEVLRFMLEEEIRMIRPRGVREAVNIS